MHRFIRVLMCAATATLTLTTVAVGLAQPAQAMTYTSADLTTWTYVDSAQPSTPIFKPDGDTPLGSERDEAGVKHTRRAYFTFDITPFAGQVLHRASFYSSERSVEDCGVTAPIEIWRTRPITSTTTWQKQPKGIEKLAEYNLGKGIICPGAYIGVDVIPVITEALARHDKTVTFGVRIGESAEGDVKAARAMRQFDLSMWVNHVPTVSDLKLRYPDRPCGTPAKHPTAGGNTTFAATATDLDEGSAPQLLFAAWPADQPEERKEFSYRALDLSGYADGTVIAWSARAGDYDDEGQWARTCYLTVDNRAPADPPVVSSKKYGESGYPGTGGPGIPGTFVLDANGDRDVVGFDYYTVNSGRQAYAVPRRPGGRAKVSFTPGRSGSDEMRARSVDAAGNRGPWQSFRFEVRDTAPWFEVKVGGVGVPSTINLYKRLPEVTSFGYSVNGGPEQQVPAVDGTGTGEIVFDSVGSFTVVGRSYAGKKMIGSETRSISVSDEPGIASDEFSWLASPIAGEPGTFTFTPRRTGVVAYLYRIDNAEEQRIDAAADGTAVLPWTPETGGYYTINVRSVNGDGVESGTAQESFSVIDSRPAVSSDAGQNWPDDDGIGRPVNVQISSDLPGVTGFVYTFDGGADQTVSGSYVDVTVVPTHAGNSSFTARAQRADGTLSEATTITIAITSGPLVTVKGPYDASPVLGRKATFTVEPSLPGVVSYRYSWGIWGDEQTVDASADGSATLTWTPAEAGYQELVITAVTADGATSDQRRLAFSVADPNVRVSGTWDSSNPAGGVGQPGWLDFYGDLMTVTTKYVWHVNDGPVQEAEPLPDTWQTSVPYTPDRAGANTLYVQRVFTDGELSPVTEYRFLVGAMPRIDADVYPSYQWSGGPGVAGTFRLSGGMPGVTSWTYVFKDDYGQPVDSGTVPGDNPQVRFTPPASGAYTLEVTGHAADGAVTETTNYWFGVAFPE
jgi:hypothetical protein